MNAGNVMQIEDIIRNVERICRKQGVSHLALFGSFATGTAAPRSDIDFIIFGCKDTEKLIEEIEEIPTLRKIDLFFYEEIENQFLKEDMDRYGKQIY